MERNSLYVAIAVLVANIGNGFFLQPAITTAQEVKKDTSFYQMYQQTIDKYHNEEFDEAIEIATRIRQEYPDEPAGAFGLLFTYQIIMRNYRVKLYEAKFDSLLNLAIKLSQNAKKRNKKDGRNYFYLGCAYGSRSMFYAQQGEWLNAFKYGSKVLQNFNRAVAYSPDFYDAYYGLGLYKYWLGAKSNFLRFLPFAKDNRLEGLEQMKIALEKGRFMKIDAMYGLYAAYYNEGEFEKALELSDQLYTMFPNNPSLLYRRGRIFQDLEKWNEAIKTFEKLQNILKTTTLQSLSYQIECLYQIAKCQYQKENYPETQRLCQDAIILEKQCDFSKELNGPLDKYSDIINELHKINDQTKMLMISQASNSGEK